MHPPAPWSLRGPPPPPPYPTPHPSPPHPPIASQLQHQAETSSQDASRHKLIQNSLLLKELEAGKLPGEPVPCLVGLEHGYTWITAHQAPTAPRSCWRSAHSVQAPGSVATPPTHPRSHNPKSVPIDATFTGELAVTPVSPKDCPSRGPPSEPEATTSQPHCPLPDFEYWKEGIGGRRCAGFGTCVPSTSFPTPILLTCF